MAQKYARGERAWGECGRSGKRVLRKDMVEDGQRRGLLVAQEWYEPRHPQERVKNVTDAEALYKPAPDQSKPDDEGVAAPDIRTLVAP